MLSVGLDMAHARLSGQVDLLLQRFHIQMLRQIKIDVFVVFHGIEHVFLADEVILIPKKEKCRCGIAAALHRYIPIDIIVV